jgi:hypothetical protein
LVPITAIGIELWAVNKMTGFDNVVIGTSKAVLDDFARSTSAEKTKHEMRLYERASGEFIDDGYRPWRNEVLAVFGVIVAVVVVLIIRYCYSQQDKKKTE